MENEELIKKYQKIYIDYTQKYEKYKIFCLSIENILKQSLKNHKLKIEPDITSRVKSFESIIGKIEDRKDFDKDPFLIYTDIAGIRVIYYYPDDVAKIEDCINENFSSVKEIKKLSNGYEATHFDKVKYNEERSKFAEFKNLGEIKGEIQVKSIFQHAWANIEHKLKYKSKEYEELEKLSQVSIDTKFSEAMDTLKLVENLFFDEIIKDFQVDLKLKSITEKIKKL